MAGQRGNVDGCRRPLPAPQAPEAPNGVVPQSQSASAKPPPDRRRGTTGASPPPNPHIPESNPPLRRCPTPATTADTSATYTADGPEYPGESMAQPGLARHPLGGASMAPRDRSGVTGDQEESRHGLEGPRQPLRPGLINERILPTEDSVAVGHRSGQPVAQHDENHPRHAVEVHCRVADRALGHTQKVPAQWRCWV